MLFRYVAWRDRRRAGSGPASVSPAALRFRVHDELDLDGFLQTGRKYSRDLPGQGFPRWYQLATHTEEYFRRRYSEYVEVVRFLPKAMDAARTRHTPARVIGRLRSL
jgi:hypothetical protein